MFILRGVEIPDSFPALYLKQYKTLIFGDLHLGYEYALQLKGVHLPQNSYQYIKYSLDEIINKTRPESIVFLGDIKHEFGRPTPQEWVEVEDLLRYLFNKGLGVHVVRGNHDNYILTILKKFNVGLHDPFMQIGNLALIHGDQDTDLPKVIKTIIMAHEHPAVMSRDISGSRYKFKCFLVGKYKQYNLIVMPALSPLSSSVGINEIQREELLSPLLRAADIDKFTPIVVEENVGVFKFPQIGFMRHP